MSARSEQSTARAAASTGCLPEQSRWRLRYVAMLRERERGAMVRVADAAAVMAIAVVVMGSLRARVMGATQPHRSSEWLRAGRSICPLLRLCCVLRARVYVCESVVPCACEGAFAASVPRACRRAPVLLCFVRACHCAAGRACGYWLGWGRCCLLERFRASNVQFSFRRLLCNREKVISTGWPASRNAGSFRRLSRRDNLDDACRRGPYEPSWRHASVASGRRSSTRMGRTGPFGSARQGRIFHLSGGEPRP